MLKIKTKHKTHTHIKKKGVGQQKQTNQTKKQPTNKQKETHQTTPHTD